MPARHHLGRADGHSCDFASGRYEISVSIPPKPGEGRKVTKPGACPCGAEAGITLIETLAALVILALVAVSVLTMFSYSMELNSTGLDYATLTNSARDKAEELLATAWYTDAAGNIVMNSDLSAGAVHQELQPENSLNLTWRVQDFEMNQSHPIPPGTTTANPTQANVKVMTITVVSTSAVGIGRRDTTVSAMKVKGSG